MALIRRSLIHLKTSISPVLRSNLLQKPRPRMLCFLQYQKFSTAERPEDESFFLRYIFLRTSVNIWEECPQGVTFDVGYKDSKPVADFDPKIPTILGLPGIMGTHEELDGLLMPLAKLGFRVIIPNLPGNAYTKGVRKFDNDVFTHSIEERTDFIKDFLKELGISRVDMLITNNCSCYSGLKLTLADPRIYRSLVMLNPAGIRPSRMMKPAALYRIICKIWDAPFLRPPLRLMILLTKPFTSKRKLSGKEIIKYAQFVHRTSYEQVEDLIKIASETPLPRFVIYSDNDTYCEREIIDEMIQELGIPESSLLTFSGDSALPLNGDPNERASEGKPVAIDVTTIKGVKFLGATGDIKLTKASIIKKLLWDYLKTVRPGL